MQGKSQREILREGDTREEGGSGRVRIKEGDIETR